MLNARYRHTTLIWSYIFIISKSICKLIAIEERLKSYGLRFISGLSVFSSIEIYCHCFILSVFNPPAPIGGSRGERRKKERDTGKEVARGCRKVWPKTAHFCTFWKNVLNSSFPVPIIFSICRKSHKITLEQLPLSNCGYATHDWFT